MPHADEVIVYPDRHEQTVCPECCDKAEHPDGETGHQWKCTNYQEGYHLD